jgi:hypothetical protein
MDAPGWEHCQSMPAAVAHGCVGACRARPMPVATPGKALLLGVCIAAYPNTCYLGHVLLVLVPAHCEVVPPMCYALLDRCAAVAAMPCAGGCSCSNGSRPVSHVVHCSCSTCHAYWGGPTRFVLEAT